MINAAGGTVSTGLVRVLGRWSDLTSLAKARVATIALQGDWSRERETSLSSNRPGAGCSNTPLPARCIITRCSESQSAPDAAASASMAVVPVAI